jgi:hypothetical protein
MIDLGLPGYSRTTSRATSRATSRSTSPVSVRSDESYATNFSEQSYDSRISTHFYTQNARSRPTSLTMNYQPRKSVTYNETTSERKANNKNKVVMRSVNTPTHSERYRNVVNSRNKYSNLVNTGSLTKTRLQPPEIREPIKFINHHKNKNYTMERMPILDEAKGSFTFDPSLPKDYLKKEEDMRGMENNITISKPNSEEYKDKDQKKEEVHVIYQPDEVENIIQPEPEPFVPSWLRNK